MKKFEPLLTLHVVPECSDSLSLYHINECADGAEFSHSLIKYLRRAIPQAFTSVNATTQSKNKAQPELAHKMTSLAESSPIKHSLEAVVIARVRESLCGEEEDIAEYSNQVMDLGEAVEVRLEVC